MEDPPICKGNLCRLCHGQFKADFQNTYRDVPEYAKPTSATVRRVIATRMTSPRKPATIAIPSKSKPRFEDLPAEIRLQIYRACLQPPNHPVLNVLVCAWVKGGGLHPDRNPYKMNRYASLMNIHASNSFPRGILVLNKRINAEVTREIYKNISFRFAGTIPSCHLPQVQWWLTAHPMKFTTSLELPMNILFGSAGRHEFMRFLRTKTLTMEFIRRLATAISNMPNLKHLTVILTLLLSRNQSAMEALNVCINETMWQKRLFTLRMNLPPSCKATIVVRVDDMLERPINHQSFDSGLANLAAQMHEFEVRLKRPSDGNHGISKNNWIVQIMKE